MHTGVAEAGTDAAAAVTEGSSGSIRPGISLVGKLELLSFCAFEGCVGVFWPTQVCFFSIRRSFLTCLRS